MIYEVVSGWLYFLLNRYHIDGGNTLDTLLQSQALVWAWKIARMGVIFLFFSSIRVIHSIALKHYRYKNIPGPPRDSFISGHIGTISRERLQHGHILDWLYRQFKEHGDVYLFWIYRSPRIVISNPSYSTMLYKMSSNHKSPYEIYNYITKEGPLLDEPDTPYKSILTAQNTDYRTRRRSIYLRALHRNNLSHITTSVQYVSDNIILALNELEETDIRGVILTYVHRIIADSMCGIDTSAYETDRKPPLNRFFSQLEMAAKMKIKRRRRTGGDMYEGVDIDEEISRDNLDPDKGIIEIRRMMYEHVQITKQLLRRQSWADKKEYDIVAAMLSQNEVSVEDEVLVSDMISLFVMGRELLTTHIIQCLYNILTNRDVYIRVIAEMDLQFGEQADSSYQTIRKLNYLEACILETLRLNPPQPTIRCISKTRRKLYFDSVVIKQHTNNTEYLISPYNIQRDERIWPNPLHFDPERFVKRNMARLKPCTFFPFSFGSRACIGKDFSIMATKVFLVKLLRMFDVSLDVSQPAKYTNYMSHRISSPLYCRFKKTKINFKRFGDDSR